MKTKSLIQGKKLISFILSVFIILGIFARIPNIYLTVNALTYLSNEEWEYYEDGAITLTRYTGSESEVLIPDKIDGKIVRQLGNYLFDNDRNAIVSVTIPSGILSVNSHTFYYCQNITDINVAENNAVYQSIDGVLYSKDGNTLIYYPAGKSTEFTIPDSVKTIGTHAFAYNHQLTGVIIGSGVETIENYAFYDCSNLAEVEFTSENQPAINYNAFSSVKSWACAIVPDSWNIETNSRWNNLIIGVSIPINDGIDYSDTWDYEIDGNAVIINLYKGSGTNITIPAVIEGRWVRKIGNHTFNNSTNREAIESVTIPESIVVIGQYSFYYCTNLQNITIPNSVVSIEYGAFSYCTSLTSIDIPDSVISVDNAFEYCENLKEMKIGKNLNYINSYMFSNCLNLESIIISDENPNYSSENGIFYNKDKTSISAVSKKFTGEFIIPDTVTNIDYYAFYNCINLTDVKIGKSVSGLSNETFTGCANLKSITVDSENQYYSSIDGILYNKEETQLVRYPTGKTGDFTIPDNVTSIRSYAFRDVRNLTNITLLNDVTDNYYYAFADCYSLETVTIEDSVTSIGEGAFYNCDNLKEIIINGDSDLTIGSRAFYNCDSLTNLNVSERVIAIGDYAFNYCNNLINISIAESDSDLTIGRYAFQYCYSLESVNVPARVTTIGDYAFYNCSNLINISIAESGSDLTIGQYAFQSCYNLKSVNVPARVTTIGERAFFNCYNLYDVYFDNSSEAPPAVGANAFTYVKSWACAWIPQSWGYAENEYWNNLIVVLYDNENVTVRDIINVPNAAITGEQLELTGTVIPSHAEKKDIIWSISEKDSGITNATVTDLNMFHAENEGTAIVKAVIIEGLADNEDYVKEFEINVTANHVPVTGIIISRLPEEIIAGESFVLEGEVSPSDATYKNIIWNIEDAGTTNSIIVDNNLYTQSEGTIVITATILSGGTTKDENYQQNFEIKIIKPEIAVDGITGVPTETRAKAPLTLTGEVSPSDAAYKYIIWSIVNAGTTGATITNNTTLNTTATGTVIVKAEIAGGKLTEGDYTEEFTITILEPFAEVTDITDVKQTTTEGVPLNLEGTVTPSSATYQEIIWSIAEFTCTTAYIDGNLLYTTGVGEVTVSAAILNGGLNGADYEKDFVIKVISENDYKISISPDSPYAFPVTTVGYEVPEAYKITIKNEGANETGMLYVELSDNSSAFILSDYNIDSIPANESFTFTIEPEKDLSAGTYNTTISVWNENIAYKTVEVTFTVIDTISNPVITVSNPKGRTGQEVIVKVSLKNNPGITNAALTLSYNNKKLSLISAAAGEIISENFAKAEWLDFDNPVYSRVTVSVFTGDGNKNNDAVLFTFKFKVIGTTEQRKLTEISGKDFELGYFDPFDGFVNENNVEFTKNNNPIDILQGTVTILPPFSYGDVNGDSVLSRADLTRLAQYFSGFNRTDENFDREAANVNGDSVLSRADLTRLAQYFSGHDRSTLGPK
jgi:hypothetical protein